MTITTPIKPEPVNTGIVPPWLTGEQHELPTAPDARDGAFDTPTPSTEETQ